MAEVEEEAMMALYLVISCRYLQDPESIASDNRNIASYGIGNDGRKSGG